MAQKFFQCARRRNCSSFEIDIQKGKSPESPRQISDGQFDVNNIIGQSGKL